jgi:nitrogen fixation protein NifB
VRFAHPDLLVCLSTNGLNLPAHVDDLAEAGVTHVTVTVNAVDPSVGGKIYQWIKINEHLCRGREAAEFLLTQQREAIVKLKSRGFIVKINTVVIPGINTEHVEAIAEEVAGLGADLMNCIPMIPVPGTPFEHIGTLTTGEMDRVRDFASLHIPQMYYCRRCRADAVGLLCSDE